MINKQTKLYLVILTIIVLYTCIISTTNMLNKSKFGYIDSQIMLSKYKAAIEVADSLKTCNAKWTDNANTLRDELKSLQEEVINNSSNWKQDKIKEHKNSLIKKEKEYRRYVDAVSKKYNNLEMELMQPVYAEINEKLKEYGEKYNYDILFGTVTGGNILHGSESHDLTTDFVNYLNNN